jgi:trimethylamine:corrinoid methyltransferase-like protein
VCACARVRLACDVCVLATAHSWLSTPLTVVAGLGCSRDGVSHPSRGRDEAGSQQSNPLIDARLHFLQSCITRHWQFDELRRAHYTTMMILAEIGGQPA